MAINTELQLQVGEQWYVMDIDQNTTFPISYYKSDINNPTAKRISLSTDISLPKTDYNNGVFAHIDDLRHVVSSFNPLARNNYRLYVNGTLQESGYIQLLNITEEVYKIRLFGGLGDYFYTMQEVSDDRDMRLSQLDFGGDFRHVIDKQFVYDSWRENGDIKNEAGESMKDFFGYAMTYQGQYDNFDNDSIIGASDVPEEITWTNSKKTYSSVDLNEHSRVGVANINGINVTHHGEYRSYYQKPIVRVKKIMEGIFSKMKQEGWTTDLDRSFFNPHNAYWNDLWMICPQYDTSSNVTSFAVEPAFGTLPQLSGMNLKDQEGPRYNGIIDKIESEKNYTVTVHIPFKLYNIQTGGTFSTYSFSMDGSLRVQCIVNIGGQDYTLNEAITGRGGGLDISYANIAYKAPFRWDGPDNSFFYEYVGNTGDKWQNLTQPGPGTTFVFRRSFSVTGEQLQTNDVSIRFVVNGNTYWAVWDNHNIRRVPCALQIRPQSGAYIDFSDESGAGIRSGAVVDFNNIIQSNDTCYDFVMSYARIFDLQFLKDPLENKVYIMTRNTFYGNQNPIDWTDKVDHSRGMDQETTPFEYKTGIMKWEDLDTKYEQKYLSTVQKEYGSVRYYTNTEMMSGERNVMEGIIFNNAVVATNSSKYYLDRTNKIYEDNKSLLHFQDNEEGRIDINYVLCFREGYGEVKPDRRFIITDDTPSMVTYGYSWTNAAGQCLLCSTYPNLVRTTRIGSYVYSLNFGEPETAYNNLEISNTSPDSTTGTSSIYSRFWRGFLRDVFDKSNKLMRLYVDLTREQVNDQLLRRFISINNTLWVINKINKHDVTYNGTTGVELINVQNPGAYISQQYVAGHIQLWYLGQMIYDSSSNELSENPSVAISAFNSGGTFVLGIVTDPEYLTWKILNYNGDDSLTLSPTQGEGTTRITGTFSQNSTGPQRFMPIIVQYGNNQQVTVNIYDDVFLHVTGAVYDDRGTITMTSPRATSDTELWVMEGDTMQLHTEALTPEYPNSFFLLELDYGLNYLGYLEGPDAEFEMSAYNTDVTAYWVENNPGWTSPGPVELNFSLQNFYNNVYKVEGFTIDSVGNNASGWLTIAPTGSDPIDGAVEYRISVSANGSGSTRTANVWVNYLHESSGKRLQVSFQVNQRSF